MSSLLYDYNPKAKLRCKPRGSSHSSIRYFPDLTPHYLVHLKNHVQKRSGGISSIADGKPSSKALLYAVRTVN